MPIFLGFSASVRTATQNTPSVVAITFSRTGKRRPGGVCLCRRVSRGFLIVYPSNEEGKQNVVKCMAITGHQHRQYEGKRPRDKAGKKQVRRYVRNAQSL